MDRLLLERNSIFDWLRVQKTVSESVSELQLVSQSVSQSVIQPVSQSVSKSVSQSPLLLYARLCLEVSIDARIF